ncbi:MAG: diguanylate cyclase [Deltaproteobacteria bacterium]|nr:diguanylate cyclase [Deltaproteobacteria bacterium]
MTQKKELAEKTVITEVGRVKEVGEKNAYILFLSGPLVGKLLELKAGETILGRSPDAAISVNDSRVSRQHISLTVSKAGTTLTDLGSTNGTFVNGGRVQTHLLQDGDKVQISSSTIFKFAYQDNLENIFHKELYKMAVIDAVTGVFNKRYFSDRLKEEFAHSKRARVPLALIMMDLDHFKKVNDTHGHLAGDFALAHIAKTVQKMVRASDVFARYGGEEFIILLRNTDEKGASQLAERIRLAVEQSPATFESHTIPVTVSLGVASLGEENYGSPEVFIEAADQYLYQSKQGGRNRVISGHYKSASS